MKTPKQIEEIEESIEDTQMTEERRCLERPKIISTGTRKRPQKLLNVCQQNKKIQKTKKWSCPSFP